MRGVRGSAVGSGGSDSMSLPQTISYASSGTSPKWGSGGSPVGSGVAMSGFGLGGADGEGGSDSRLVADVGGSAGSGVVDHR